MHFLDFKWRAFIRSLSKPFILVIDVNEIQDGPLLISPFNAGGKEIKRVSALALLELFIGVAIQEDGLVIVGRYSPFSNSKIIRNP